MGYIRGAGRRKRQGDGDFSPLSPLCVLRVTRSTSRDPNVTHTHIQTRPRNGGDSKKKKEQQY